MDLFLRAKHWQLFIAFVVLPIVIGMFLMINMLMNILPNGEPDPVEIFNHLKFFPLVIILFMGGKMCWQWAVAIRLQRLAPPGVRFKNTAFQIFFWFIILFYPVLFFFFFYMFRFIGSIGMAGHIVDPTNFIWFAAIFPFSLFNTFCMFYCYYSSAKTYKTIELQRQVTFSDFVLEFMLIWFFFVGVWILQPKINKMIDPDIFSESDNA
jgi:hypothetical protein